MSNMTNSQNDELKISEGEGITVPPNTKIKMDTGAPSNPLDYKNPSPQEKMLSTKNMKSDEKMDPYKRPDYFYKEITETNAKGEVSVKREKHSLPPPIYDRKVSCESAYADIEVIVPKTIQEYTDCYKKTEEKSAREILTMCRIVYEAEKTLNSAQFSEFCSAIGYKDYSSVIRKFVVIGKIQPRLIQHAELLPASWTSLYLLTQIPAQHFENVVYMNRSLKKMSVGAVKELVNETRDLNNVGSLIKATSMTQEEVDGKLLRSTIMAKAYFTKIPDDLDWYAFEKAMLEVQSNLPVRIIFDNQAKEVFYKRKSVRYEKVKSEQSPEVFKPSTWDLGRTVDGVKSTSLIESEDAILINSQEIDSK